MILVALALAILVKFVVSPVGLGIAGTLLSHFGFIPLDVGQVWIIALSYFVLRFVEYFALGMAEGLAKEL